MTDINKETKVYALIASRGSYDDYRSWNESIHLTLQGAEKAKKIFDDKHLLIGEYPMTEDEWRQLDYGLDKLKADKGIESFVDCGGFTAQQFKLMDDMMNRKWNEYYPCEIEEFKLEE